MLILDNDTVRPFGKCPCEAWPMMRQSGTEGEGRRGHLQVMADTTQSGRAQSALQTWEFEGKLRYML